jgi:hypothetical protein
MRLIKILLLFLIPLNLFSQRLVCDSIYKFSLESISQELFQSDFYNDKKYSPDDIKCFATKLSEYDKLKGIKRILTYSGMFETPCLKCLYHNIGFETYPFSIDDVISQKIDIFVQGYNDNMEKMIPVSQLNQIKQRQMTSDRVFVSYLPATSKFDFELISDTLLNLKMHNDTLEQLFKDDIKYLKVSFSDSSLGFSLIKYNYTEVKSQGVKIKIRNETIKNIFIIYDFSYMPDRLDICWCGILEKKYYLQLPIKIK